MKYLPCRLNLIKLGGDMSSQLQDFKNKLNSEVENKTDKADGNYVDPCVYFCRIESMK